VFPATAPSRWDVISHLDAPDTPEKMTDTLKLWEDLKSRSDSG